MKKKLLLLFTILAIGLTNVWAYDFCADTPYGKRLYYDIIGGNAVVTYQNSSWPAYSNLTGALVIPASVTYNGTTYSVTSIGDRAFHDCSGLTSVTIPNSVTSIGYEAFRACVGLRSVTIGNSVTSIGSFAFKCCGLTSVTIPNSVTTIGASAFDDCICLTSVTIGNSVTSIGAHAFEDCIGLTSVTIPSSVTCIEYGTFYGCIGLTSIIVDSVNTHYDSRNNCKAIIETNTNKLIAGCKNTIIPNSVTSIGEEAFAGCSGLTSVTIPNSVTTIGDCAFDNCSGLTRVTIPNSVTSIGDFAFNYCTGLTSVTIPNSVTSIGSYAFCDCRGLTSVTIPNSVTYIGGAAFRGCSGLTSVTIPNSVTYIRGFTFSGCSGLTEITSEARTAPSLGEYAFNGVNIQIPVNIPCGTLSSYMSCWSYFSNFVEDAGASFEVSSNNPAMGYVTVLTQPTCTAPHAVVKAVANPGYRFVRWDNGVTNNPYELDLISDTTLVAIFESASTQGVDDVMMNSCNITTRDGMIVVKGAEGELLRIFDIEGRVIVSERVEEGKQYSMPHSGVYLVQVGNDPAQKVVVIK